MCDVHTSASIWPRGYVSFPTISRSWVLQQIFPFLRSFKNEVIRRLQLFEAIPTLPRHAEELAKARH